MTDASNGSSWVYTDKLENAFRKVRDIQEFIRTYGHASVDVPVSVEDIKWAVEEKYGLKINVELVAFEAQHIRGMMERYEDGRANVFVRESQDANLELNGFWHRFITVKEIAHLAIDEREDWNEHGCFTIEELIKENRAKALTQIQMETQSEHLAEIVAIELLYPMEFRRGDIASGKDYMDLSKGYGIPPYVIQTATSSGYMKMARAVWHEIGGHDLGGVGSDPAAE